MAKKLLLAAAGLCALALVALFASSFFIGSIIKTGVNRFGPSITKTTVALEGASLSPLTGTGSLSGLTVGNPEGWSSDKAFYLGRVHLEVEPKSIFGDHVVIQELTIEEPEFVYETKIVSSNIKELLNNIEAAVGGGQASRPATKEGRPLKFEVKKLTVSGGKVTLGVGPTALTSPMPDLTLTDLGTREGGITADQLAGAVLRNILGTVVQATAGAALKAGGATGAAATDAAGEAVKKAGEGLKKLFGGDEKR